VYESADLVVNVDHIDPQRVTQRIVEQISSSPP
jgi:hypothetical protein